MNKHWLYGTVAAVLSVLISASIAYAALTFDATTVTSDAALTLTTAVGSNVVVTRGITFNAATSTDSLYVGGLLQHTGGTASATALVIGNDVPLFRNAANQLRLQGILSVRDGGTFNAATTSDSLYIGGLMQHTGGTASATALVIGGDFPIFRSSANTLTMQGSLTLTNSGALTVAGNVILANAETIGNSTNDVVFVNSTTVTLASTTPTTTPGVWVSTQAGTASTSVLQIGGMDEAGEINTKDSCIQMWRGNKSYRVYLNGATGAAGVQVEAGTCIP